MKVEKNKILLLPFILIIIIPFCNIKSQDSLCSVNVKLFSLTMQVDIPCGYNKQIFNYDEGIFVSFTYPDTSNITFFEGSNIRTPLLHKDDGYIPQNMYIDSLLRRKISEGYQTGNFWREDIYINFIVYYKNVLPDKVIKFNAILNTISACRKKE